MADANVSSASIAIIAAMVTPALLILGSASLVASALVRMARVVDRARVLAAIAHDGTCEKLGMTPDQLRASLERHAIRARYTERSIALLYAAVVVFIATCLAIAFDRVTGQSLSWLPVVLAVAGTLLLLSGGAWMVAESKLSGEQIAEEIGHALARLEGRKP
jgi:flagellar biosynthesis protein FliQ